MEPSSLKEAVEAVRREKTRGARWSLYTIARAVIEDVESGVLTCDGVGEAARAVRGANRSMAPLANLAVLLEEACARGRDLAEVVRNVMYHQERSIGLIVEYSRQLPGDSIVATFSYSSTVESILLANMGSYRQVIVVESKPGGEGAVLASNLKSAGARAVLYPDAMMYRAVESSDYVLVGADAVTLDGCLVNKVGTRLLAAVAWALGKPFIAVFDAMKIHPSSTCATHPVEERSYLAPGYGPVRYPLFDLTPSREVKAALTEDGLKPYTLENLRETRERLVEEVLS